MFTFIRALVLTTTAVNRGFPRLVFAHALQKLLVSSVQGVFYLGRCRACVLRPTELYTSPEKHSWKLTTHTVLGNRFRLSPTACAHQLCCDNALRYPLAISREVLDLQCGLESFARRPNYRDSGASSDGGASVFSQRSAATKSSSASGKSSSAGSGVARVGKSGSGGIPPATIEGSAFVVPAQEVLGQAFSSRIPNVKHCQATWNQRETRKLTRHCSFSGAERYVAPTTLVTHATRTPRNLLSSFPPYMDMLGTAAFYT